MIPVSAHGSSLIYGSKTLPKGTNFRFLRRCPAFMKELLIFQVFSVFFL